MRGAGRPVDAAAASLILAAFLVSRLAADAAGLWPDPTAVVGIWQNLAVEDLRADLFGALWKLHAQPPLWNLLLGLAAKGCAGALDCIAAASLVFNRVLTLAAAACVWMTLRMAGAGRAAAWLGAAALALSPSALFYEALPSYPHMTMALTAALAAGLAGLSRGGGPGRLAAVYAPAAALCWSWALFHPLFMGVVFVAAVIADRRAALSRIGLGLAFAALVAALAPAAKTWAQHGVFTPSSWVGFNLAQTAPLEESDRARCSFEAYLDAAGREDDARRPAPLHDPAVIPWSRDCLERSVDAVLAHPLEWADGRLRQLVASHRLRPYEYAWYSPIGWDRMPVRDVTRARDRQGPVGRWWRGIGWAWATLYAAVGLGALVLLLRGRFGSRAGAVWAFLALIAWVTAAGHVANGLEQNRMRWAVEPVWLTVAILSAGDLLRGRPGGARRGAPPREGRPGRRD